MDEIDRANERAAQFLDHALANVPKVVALPVGNCHCFNCGEPVDYIERWCDSDCRNDWDARQQLRKLFT